MAIVGTAIIAVGCVEGTVSNDEPTGPYCNIYISRTKGMVNKHFSARITYSSNFVRDPEYGYRGSLPPGQFRRGQRQDRRNPDAGGFLERAPVRP